jgi:hypothetical protein
MMGFYKSGFVLNGPVNQQDSPGNTSSSLDIQADITGYRDRSMPEVDIITTTTPAWTEEEKLKDMIFGCQNYCVGHGHCDEKHLCICDSYWTTNPFIYVGRPYQPNCDWNVIVVIGSLMGIAFGLIALMVVLHCCLRAMCRGGKTEKRRRYNMLSEDDMEGFGAVGSGLKMPKSKSKPKRAHIADSDEDSDVMYESKNHRFFGSKTDNETKPMLGETSKQ